MVYIYIYIILYYYYEILSGIVVIIEIVNHEPAFLGSGHWSWQGMGLERELLLNC